MTRRFPYPGLGYCEAVVSEGLVYAVATDPKLGADVEAQTRGTLAELDAILARTGSGRAGLLQATVYLADISAKARMTAIWLDWIGPEENWPRRACVGVALPDGCLVEITVTARVLDGSR
ncbi:MAG: RidA family protein [Pseudomonadota bacterium]